MVCLFYEESQGFPVLCCLLFAAPLVGKKNTKTISQFNRVSGKHSKKGHCTQRNQTKLATGCFHLLRRNLTQSLYFYFTLNDRPIPTAHARPPARIF